METVQQVTTEVTTQQSTFTDASQQPLRERVKSSLENYFARLDGHTPAELYKMVMEEVEIPLLEAVLKYTRGNQSKAAIILGISRGTLRKKIAMYKID